MEQNKEASGLDGVHGFTCTCTLSEKHFAISSKTAGCGCFLYNFIQ
jgi:hypothetical protein